MDDKIIINNETFYPIDILDIKPFYYISKNGKIYSKYLKNFLKYKKNKDGYYEVTLRCKNNKPKTLSVSRIVLQKFKGNPPNDIINPTCEHIDGNIHNNSIENLCWLSHSKNSSTRKNKGIGETNHEAKLTEKEVIKIANLLIENKLTLKEIGHIFNVNISTISNIKRKKNWKHLLKDYDFNIKSIKTKEEILENKIKIMKLFKEGYIPKEVIKMGYKQTTVYRYYKEFLSNKELKYGK